MEFMAGIFVGLVIATILNHLARYSSRHVHQDGSASGDRSDPQRAGSSVTGSSAPSLEIEISIEEWVNRKGLW